VARVSTRPVGLLGVVRKTTSGASDSTSATAVSRSRVKSALRSAVITPVPVMFAMWACSTYDGSKTSARRPGPP
jgi:hypothetical protein